MGHDLDDEELKATKDKFYKFNKNDLDKNFDFKITDVNYHINVLRNYLNGMRFSIANQTYFEINYEQTKEFYDSIYKLIEENNKLMLKNSMLKNIFYSEEKKDENS